MNVLIIPEDFRYDQLILKPLLERIVRSRPSVRIRICQDPLLGGDGEALKSERIAEIMERYRGMVRVFVLCVDRDGRLGRRQRLDELEKEFGKTSTFLAENAWEEIETWALAGLDLPNEWNWAQVREEVHVKEVFFDELARLRGLSGTQDGGRKVLGSEAAFRVEAIRQKCPDDFDVLARRLEVAVGIR